MEESRAARFLVPQRDYSIIITTMSDIAKLILRNLEICDLLRCKLVCSLWRDTVNEITRGKFYILSLEIKLRYMKNAIEKPQIILHYLKLPRKSDVKLITEFSSNISEKCSLCCRPFKYGPVLNTISHQTYSNLFSVTLIDDRQFKYSLDCKRSIDVAIFPTLPGVQMLRFSYHKIEVRKIARLGILSVAERLRLPKEDLKCVIWFSSDPIEGLFMRNQDYAVAGISSLHLEECINIGIAFHGSRVKAASMNLYKTFIYNEELSLHPSFSESHIQALKKYKIDQSKCIAFMFSTYHKQCSNNYTLLLFKESFPDVPVIYYRCSDYFGNDCMPGKKAVMPEKSTNVKVATLVLVWYD